MPDENLSERRDMSVAAWASLTAHVAQACDTARAVCDEAQIAVEQAQTLLAWSELRRRRRLERRTEP